MADDISLLTPDTQRMARRWIKACADLGYTVKLTSTLRTCAEQNGLYAIGRTAPGQIITGSMGCMSWHTLGRAWDFKILGPSATDADYQKLGMLGETLGLKWGGRFGNLYDPVHLEWHPGYAIEQLCPQPTACAEAVAASRALNLGDPGWGNVALLAGALAAGAVGTWAAFTYA